MGKRFVEVLTIGFVCFGAASAFSAESEIPGLDEDLNQKMVTPPEAPVSPKFAVISIGAGFDSTRFSVMDRSNGSPVTLLTKLNSSETFSYSQYWSSDFQSTFHFGLQNYSFNSPQSAVTIEKVPTLHQFDVSAQWKLAQKWNIGADFGLGQVAYLSGVSSAAVGVSLSYVPNVQIFSSYELYKRDHFLVGFMGLLGVSTPVGVNLYRSAWNLDYGAALYLQQRAFNWMDVQGGIRGNYENENTSVTQQSQTDLGGYVKLCFPLDRRAQ
jgi:hypothetical protein